MADKEDLTPEEETESFLLEEGEVLPDSDQEFEEEWEPAPEEKKGALVRVLILVLLLVALGGIGFYYFSDLPEAPAPAPAPTKKQPIVMPPAPAKVAETAPAPAPEPAKTQPSPEPQAIPAAATPPAPEPVPVPAAAPPAAPAAAPATSVGSAALPPAPASAFVLDAGTFLLKTDRAEAEKKVRKLGFEPRAQKVNGTVTMTRLRIGTFPQDEARTRLAQLKPAIPGVFAMTRDGQTTLYAGSFFVQDQARRYADELHERGITVEKETTAVTRPLQRVIFGNFPDRESAEGAALKARAAGLTVAVVKSRSPEP